jgi:hypothetical protein
VPGKRTAVVIQAEDSRDAAEAHVAGDGDRQLELFGGIEQILKTLHELIVDRFVIAHEAIGELECGALTVGEQRALAIRANGVVGVLADRLLRRRRRTPFESNGATVKTRDQKPHELTLADR